MKTKHKEKGLGQKWELYHGCETQLYPKIQMHDFISTQDDIGNLNELKHSTQQYRQTHSESLYKDCIQKLKDALLYKHNQELRDQQSTLQQQYNMEIINIRKQNNIEKQNLCKDYQNCIDQNGIQYQKALENEMGKVYKEYQCCVDQNGIQWQKALEHKQNQYNKMKDMRDDLQDCIEEYLQDTDKLKGKYCCQECGKGWKHYDEYLFHMKKHEK